MKKQFWTALAAVAGIALATAGLEDAEVIVADAIAEAAGAETAMLHSCHTLTAEEAEREETYVSLMRQNLAALERALND